MERRDIAEQRKRLLEAKGRVRLARFDDLDAIMDINDNIYEGIDYMPALFYTFLHSKQHKMYVYEEDGKLIALDMFRFDSDDADLVTAMAGRVRPSSMGRGFGRAEVNPMLVQLLKDHPTVSRYLGVTLYKPNIAAKMKEWRELFRWNFLRCEVTDTDWLRQRIASMRTPKTDSNFQRYLSYSKAIQWLNKSDEIVQFVSKYASEFVPLGAEWLPIRVNRSGLRQIFSASNSLVTATRTTRSNKNQAKDGSKDQKEEEDDVNEILGLSFSTYLPCKGGISMDINFLGDREDIFLAHVKSHLMHSIGVVKEGVQIVYKVHFPLTMNSKDVEEKLNGILGKRFSSDNINVTQVVEFIADIPKSKL